MKKSKFAIIVILTIIMLFSSFSIFLNSTVYAAEEEPAVDTIYKGIYGRATNKFEFNASEMLAVYAENSADGNEVLQFRHNINEGKIIPVYQFEENQDPAPAEYQDAKIDGRDATMIKTISQVNFEGMDFSEKSWSFKVNNLVKSLVEEAKKIGATEDDIIVTIKVTTPKIEGYTSDVESFEVNNKTGFTDAALAIRKRFEETNSEINAQENLREKVQQIVSVTATIKNDYEYKLVIGTDNNYYYLQTKEPVTPEPTPEVKEFDTELTYIAIVEGKDVSGKMEKETFIPNYDKENPKKDADVTAIIKSTTNLDILTVDGKAVGTDKDHPNEDGWYYYEANNKKVIAKLYPFEDVNNLEDNGTVVYDKNDVENNHRGKIKVILGSEDNLTSEENISIQWPYRIIEEVQDPKEITKDTTKVTVTVTTNLPTDKAKLPEGWNFTDTELGKSQHQMVKVYEKADGDVKETPVFQENGRNDKVDTEVTIKWPETVKPAPEPKPESPAPEVQTGSFSAPLIIAILGFAAFAITRYYKLKK